MPEPPITAQVTSSGGDAEWIEFSNGHKIYFDPSSHHHGWCDKHERNCLSSFTFAERWALQHATEPEPPPLTRKERLDRALNRTSWF